MTSICIFGSVARKDFDCLSDKDVLIVSNASKNGLAINKQWKENGWSVAAYTENRLTKMADAGSLFIQHIKDEGLITDDPDGALRSLLDSFEPKSDYSSEIDKTITALSLLERVPFSHELDYWSADLLHVLIRNLGILKLANEGIYEFSFKRIAEQLINLDIISTDDIETFEGLRFAKTGYRSGQLPIISVKKTVEGGLRVVERICGASLERSRSLDFSIPDFKQSYFNLRAMEKILVAYNGLSDHKGGRLSGPEQELWKRITDPRAYSWDVKTKKTELWQLLLDAINKDNHKNFNLFGQSQHSLTMSHSI